MTSIHLALIDRHYAPVETDAWTKSVWENGLDHQETQRLLSLAYAAQSAGRTRQGEDIPGFLKRQGD